MNTYESARKYREVGFSPIPLRGKHPIFPWKEYQEGVADNSELFEWFCDRPDVNVGLVTGGVSGGLLVLDWDDLPAFDSWAAEHPELANTKTVMTGKGGHHLYFRLPNGDGLTTQPFSYGGGHAGEIRYEGGVVVAPPSTHPETGKRYRWLTGKEVPIIELESWSELGLDLGKESPEVCGTHNADRVIPKGERNTTLTSLAGTMRARRMSIEAIKVAIR